MVLKDKQIFAIRRILEISSSPQAIECLGKSLKTMERQTPESVQQYLQLLTKQAVDPLCLLLGQLESGKWRKMICDRLAELSQDRDSTPGQIPVRFQSLGGQPDPLCPWKNRTSLGTEISGAPGNS